MAEAQSPPVESKQQRDARMKWWREARLGLFIHWGVYSVPAGTYDGKQIPSIGEWIMSNGKIPVARYAEYPKQFNPVKFDAESWVKLAQAAGMKYIVITSKHHDGFAMFKSSASPFNIVDATPFKRDVIAELAAACKKHGMKLGLYYSQAQDWHHPGGAAMRGQWDKAQAGSMDEYIDKVAVPQVKEILTKYGPIVELWWDTPTGMTKERAAKFLPLLKLQPHLIVNNRLGGGVEGDMSTPEQFIPATGIPGKDFEVCMTMNDTWGFKSYDNNWKSAEDLIQKTADIASKGGNFLLNVGPTSEGLIPQPSVERLEAMGKWIKVNGESIYGTSAGPFSYLKWGRATRKGQTLYLHVFHWPKDGVLRVPLKNQVKTAYLLSNPKVKVPAKVVGERIELKLPATAPDAIDSVIAMQIEGEPAAIPVPSMGKSGAASSSEGAEFGPAKAFDGSYESHWQAAKGQKTGWLEVTFDKPARIGHVNMVEGWETQAFIRKYRLEYKDGDQWKTAFEGTRIGRAFSKSFGAVTARSFRLVILEATDAPRMEELQLMIDE
ncbi:MAG: alpha-L-fucosidase [Bryobacterales bacterium]|nr:alpha-L-fucosidase [Bryobacterales bacterium]